MNPYVQYFDSTLVQCRHLQVNNLPKPHGDCDSKQLTYVKHYSTEECYLDCLTTLQNSRCGCRDIYMPQINGKKGIKNRCLYSLQKRAHNLSYTVPLLSFI